MTGYKKYASNCRTTQPWMRAWWKPLKGFHCMERSTRRCGCLSCLGEYEDSCMQATESVRNGCCCMITTTRTALILKLCVVVLQAGSPSASAVRPSQEDILSHCGYAATGHVPQRSPTPATPSSISQCRNTFLAPACPPVQSGHIQPHPAELRVASRPDHHCQAEASRTLNCGRSWTCAISGWIHWARLPPSPYGIYDSGYDRFAGQTVVQGDHVSLR